MEKEFLSNLKIVLFDLDGTLMNTLPGLTQLVNLLRRDFDKRPISEEEVSRYIGKGLLVLIHRALTRSMDEKVSDATFGIALDSLRAHIERKEYEPGVPYNGVKENLEMLKKAGLKLGVVTNKPYNMTLEVLEKNGMCGYFDVIVGGDTAEKPKPSGEPVNYALKEMGIFRKEALMVGDSGNDSQAAKAAGVRCVLVRTGWSEGISLEEIAKRDEASAILNDIPSLANEIVRCKEETVSN